MIRKRRDKHYNPWEKRRRKNSDQQKTPLNKSDIPVAIRRTRTIAKYKQTAEYNIEQWRDAEALEHIQKTLARNIGYGLARNGWITFHMNDLGAGIIAMDATVDVVVP